MATGASNGFAVWFGKFWPLASPFIAALLSGSIGLFIGVVQAESKIADHEKRLTALESTMPQISTRLSRIEGKVDVIIAGQGLTVQHWRDGR